MGNQSCRAASGSSLAWEDGSSRRLCGSVSPGAKSPECKADRGRSMLMPSLNLSTEESRPCPFSGLMWRDGKSV